MVNNPGGKSVCLEFSANTNIGSHFNSQYFDNIYSPFTITTNKNYMKKFVSVTADLRFFSLRDAVIAE